MTKKKDQTLVKQMPQEFEKGKYTYLQKLGSRIMCEINDLKRTSETAAEELNVPIKELDKIIKEFLLRKRHINL